MPNLIWKKIENNSELSEKEKSAVRSVGGEIKRNMDTGVVDGEIFNEISAYKCEFNFETTEPSDLYLIDLGVIKNLCKVKFFLNGNEIGETTSRHTQVGYIVPKSLLNKANSLIAVVTAGVEEDLWIRGKGKIKYIPEDFTDNKDELPETVSLIPLKNLPSVTGFKADGNRITLNVGGNNTVLDFFDDGIIRVRRIKSEKESMIERLRKEAQTLKPLSGFEVEEDGEEIIITAEKIRVKITKKEFSLTVERDGKTVFNHLPEPMTGDKSVGISLPLDEDEDIYGLGENATPSMNKRGTREDIWVIHDWIHCDMPLPYFISSKGYGFYLNNSYHSYFDMGKTFGNRALIWALDGELDYFVMLGETPKEIVSRYTSVTGKTKMPPRWAFGFYQSKTGIDSTEMIREKIEKFHKNQIPLDVVCIDPAWENGLNDIEWDRKNFPSTEEFMNLLKTNRLHLMLWTSPFVTKDTANYFGGDKNGYFLKDENGKTCPVLWWKDYESGIVDFSNPDACEWWQKPINKRLSEGADIFKIDGGDSGSVPVTTFNSKGESAAEFHNLYPVYYAKSVYEGAQKARPDKRVMTWERTGFVGNGRFPATWGGDQSADFVGSRVLIKGGQQAGLAGVFYWSPDIGGFGECEGTNDEFFIRSYQWGCLSPLARSHGNRAEPFDFSDLALKLSGDSVRLRYRLLPYYYSVGFNAWLNSVPVARPMFFEYPFDKKCRNLDYQYFIGDYIMSAPIFNEFGRADMSADREIYFPDNFVDFFTGKEYKKGTTVNYHAEIDFSPLFVKKGAIIPQLKQIMNTNDYKGDLYDLHIYPSETESEFVLYFDDGESLDYQKGIYNAVKITCIQTEKGVSLSFCSIKNDYNIDKIEFNIIIHRNEKTEEVGKIEFKGEKVSYVF